MDKYTCRKLIVILLCVLRVATGSTDFSRKCQAAPSGDCADRARCSHRHDDSKLLSVPHYAFAKYNCRCDNMCYNFKDCCTDVADINRRDANFPPFDVIDCIKPHNVFTFGYHVYYVQRCPVDFSDDVIREGCEGNSSGDITGGWPVTDENNILYRNQYCALCNRVGNYTQWNVRLGCHRRAQALLSSTNHTSLLHFIYSNDAGCSVSFELTHAVQRHEAGARVCKPHVRSCLTSFSNDCIRHQCEADNASYSLVYINNDRIAYKNEHCAHCNDVSMFECSDLFTIKALVTPIRVIASVCFLYSNQPLSKLCFVFVHVIFRHSVVATSITYLEIGWSSFGKQT